MMMRFLLPLLVLAMLLAPPAQASSYATDATSAGQWIEAELRLDYVSLTRIVLDGTLDVREYTDGAHVYTAQDVRDAYRGANRFGGAAGEAFVQELETTLAGHVEDALAAAFPRAVSRDLESVVVDRGSLRLSGGREYDPPVRVTVRAVIERSYAHLGLGDYSDAAVDAAFDAGAQVATSFTLRTTAGYRTTFIVTPPPGLAFAESSEPDAVSADGRTLTVLRDNTQGQEPLEAPVTVALVDPDATPPAQERLVRRVEVRFGDAGAEGLPVVTEVAIAIHALRLADRFPDALPESVRLDIVSADALRALHQSGAISDAKLAEAERGILDGIARNLSAILDAPVNATGGFVRADLAAPPSRPFAQDPGVRLTATATGVRPVEGPANALEVALAVGAEVALELNLPNASDETTYVFHAPEGLVFEEASGGNLSEDGERVTFVATAASGAVPASLVLRDPHAPTFSAQEATLGVLVDLHGLDVALAGGPSAALLADVVVTAQLHVLEVPEDLRASLDPRVHLEYLPSDGLRLLRAEGVLDDETFARLEQSLLDQLSARLEGALGGPLEVRGGFDAASLDPSLVADPLSGEQPVLFRASASLRQPLAPGAPQAQAALTLYAHQQTFQLPRVAGLETSYVILLPKGIAFQDVRTTGGEGAVDETPDGRARLRVTPTEDTATTHATLAVTPLFVLVELWPALLVAVLLLVLLVGTPIALVMRRRKRT